jgi:O-antigen ligase
VKWVGLIIVLAAVFPLSDWLRRNPSQSPKVWMLLGIMPFLFNVVHLYMAAISWVDWPGYVKGLEFTVMDAVAIALYLSFPTTRAPLPFRLSMALYLLPALLSATVAEVPMAAVFYCWQLVRMFLVYAVVARGCNDPRVAPSILNGMALGLVMEAGVCIWERFGLGILQAGGTVGHQNLLGMMSHFIVFPFFALLLAGKGGRLPAVVVLAGLIVEVLTTSRATLGLAAFGYAGVFVLSALRQWTPRKARILMIAVAMISVAAPIAFLSFENRFAAEQSSDYDERAAFKSAAAMMLSDHPLGVGANNYVIAANGGGYNHAAGVASVFGSDSAQVHNIYYLVAAETGYLGLLTFVLLIFRPLSVAFLCGWRNRADARGDLLLGLGMALLTVYLHSWFEWIFITYPSQYMLTMDVGMVAGVAMQLGYWGRRSPQPVQRQEGVLSNKRMWITR